MRAQPKPQNTHKPSSQAHAPSRSRTHWPARALVVAMASPLWLSLCGFALLLALFGLVWALYTGGGPALHGSLLAAVGIGLGVSVLACAAVLFTQRFHAHLSMDHDLAAVQKLHSTPVPRVGGVPVYVGFACVALWGLPSGAAQLAQTLVLAGLPVFALGLVEDLTKRISPRARLWAAMLSGVLACWWGGAVLPDVGFDASASLFAAAPALAWAFSAFAMAGASNAANMIDGLNGLASGCLMLLLLAFGGLAVVQQDAALALVCVAMAACLLGFWVFNYPFGKIFLGDGGAYFAGFVLGAVAILAKARHPELSAWMVLSVLAYPVIEVLYSIGRRLRTKAAPDQPDFAHLHQLVQQVLSANLQAQGLMPLRQQLNSECAPYLWAFTLLSLAFAGLGWVMDVPALGFVMTYVVYWLVYRSLGGKVYLKLDL